MVDKSHYTFETNANFYFKRVLSGFFVSGGGFFGKDKAKPSEGGAIPNSLRSGKNAGLQLGAGFSQEITPALNMSLVSQLGQDFYSGNNGRLFIGFKLGYNWLAVK
ncbi:MAG: hypothetical protein U5L96_12470 [Owenweeksia sp.]|nr:hypothetical protein [Owenweeksia sp.]